MGLITIKEYAERNGLTHDNVRHKCQRGAYKTAVKLGRDWLISEEEVDRDHRVKSGAYVRNRNDQSNKSLRRDKGI